jgi:ribonucleotide monophosphatase NagD (HAD superfamily)
VKGIAFNMLALLLSTASAFTPSRLGVQLVGAASHSRRVSQGIFASAAKSPHATNLQSLLSVSDQYDCFLLDQFGVIHDGKAAYDGAVAAVSELQRRGKKIVIISNSSRRRGDTVARLLSMGFGPCEGDNGETVGAERSADAGDDDASVPPIGVVTSGDLVFEGLLARDAPPYSDLGIRCLVFGNGAEDEEYVRECGKVAAPIEQADFILARGLFTVLGAGPDLLRQPFVPYTPEAEESFLRTALARRPGGLPLLVANPDEVRPDGKDSPMPGTLARRYREMGATDIRYVGKPHPLIYDACRAKLRAASLGGGGSVRVAAVGDSLHHDVLGAARNGLDSVFICSGVHSAELQVPQAQDVPPPADRLDSLLSEFAEETGGVRPTHVLAAFRLNGRSK